VRANYHGVQIVALALGVVLTTVSTAAARTIHSTQAPGTCTSSRSSMPPGVVEISFRLSDAVWSDDHSVHFIAARSHSPFEMVMEVPLRQWWGYFTRMLLEGHRMCSCGTTEGF